MTRQHIPPAQAAGWAFLTPDLHIAHVDEQFATLSGHAAAAHIGCTVGELFPALAPLIVPLLQHVLADGTPVIDAALPPGTSEQPTLLSCYPVRSRAGVLLGLDVVLHAQPTDAAALPDAVAEQLHHDVLRAVAAHVPVGMALFDGEDMRLRWANSAYQQVFEEPYRSSGMIGLRLEQFAPHVVERGVIDVFHQVAAIRQPFIQPEYRHDGPRRGTTYWHWSLVPLDVPGRAAPNLLLVMMDITSTVQAHHEATTATAQLTAMLQQMPAGVIIAKAPSEQIIIGNAEAERLLRGPIQPGTRLEEASATWNVVRPDGSAYAADERALARALRTGETVTQEEARIEHGDGTQTTVLVNAAPVRDSAGAITAGVITLLDISGRVHAEQALRASEERLHLALNAGHMGTWELDLGQKTIRCSESTNTLFGLSHTNGPRPHDVYLNAVHPDDRAQVLESIDRAAHDGVEHIVEYRVLLPSNQARWLSSRGIVAHDLPDQASLLRGAVIDITERRRIEEQQAFLVEASKVLGASFDYPELLAHLAKLMVPQFADWCGIELVAVNGSTEFSTIAHSDPERAAELHTVWHRHRMTSGLRAKKLATIYAGVSVLYTNITDAQLVQNVHDQEELALLRALGQRSVIVVPLTVRGHGVGSMTCVMADTDRRYTTKDVEFIEYVAGRASVTIENARLYRDVQEALQVRNAFVSIAAHELKTPLTGLLGQTQLLQRRMARTAESSERDTRTVGIIKEQAQRLNTMITMLLDMSRIERGQLTITRAPLDVAALVQRVADEVLPSLVQHTLTCTRPAEPLIIIGDALRLEQVLHNLIQNAVKYSPSGGAIALEVQAHGEWASCAVTDHGVGIPKAAIGAIFQQFYRVESAATQYIAGFGIGLYVVREIVAQHNGEISVTSTEGQGSTFTIMLPAGPR